MMIIFGGYNGKTRLNDINYLNLGKKKNKTKKKSKNNKKKKIYGLKFKLKVFLLGQEIVILQI
jgi:hypothetical protein